MAGLLLSINFLNEKNIINVYIFICLITKCNKSVSHIESLRFSKMFTNALVEQRIINTVQKGQKKSNCWKIGELYEENYSEKESRIFWKPKLFYVFI